MSRNSTTQRDVTGVELPLWGDAPDPHPYDTGGLPLANQLEHDLVEWNREWMSYGEVEERPDSWKNRGWQLFDRLESALRGSVEVLPMFDDGESSDGAGDGRSE